jgi:hypothetical protein
VENQSMPLIGVDAGCLALRKSTRLHGRARTGPVRHCATNCCPAGLQPSRRACRSRWPHAAGSCAIGGAAHWSRRLQLTPGLQGRVAASLAPGPLMPPQSAHSAAGCCWPGREGIAACGGARAASRG